MTEYNLLTALGVSFNENPDFSITPEETLISLVKDFDVVNNRRLLGLLILAFHHFQDFYRPDLMAHLMKNLDSKTCRIIGAIIFRETLKNPARWNCVKRVIDKLPAGEKIYLSSKELVDAKGADKSFKAFNLFITPIASQVSKKLLKDHYVLATNPWFKARVLFGTVSRADVFTIRENNLESTPYRIAKRFNQSIPSITKIWNDMLLSQELGSFS